MSLSRTTSSESSGHVKTKNHKSTRRHSRSRRTNTDQSPVTHEHDDSKSSGRVTKYMSCGAVIGTKITKTISPPPDSISTSLSRDSVVTISTSTNSSSSSSIGHNSPTVLTTLSSPSLDAPRHRDTKTTVSELRPFKDGFIRDLMHDFDERAVQFCFLCARRPVSPTLITTQGDTVFRPRVLRTGYKFGVFEIGGRTVREPVIYRKVFACADCFDEITTSLVNKPMHIFKICPEAHHYYCF
jgi:hypothetical protein